MLLLTNAFYGEDPQVNTGTWTVKVVDTVSGDTGTLEQWEIRIWGH